MQAKTKYLFVHPCSAQQFMCLVREKKVHLYNNSLHKECADMIKHHINGRVLDVGCGRRNYLTKHAQIDSHSCRIIGVDLSAESIKHNADIDYKLVADAENLPIRKDIINCALMLDVAEHLVDPVHCLRELASCLGPVGRVIVLTPNLYGMSGISLLGKIIPLSLRPLVLRIIGKSPKSSIYPLHYRINNIGKLKAAAAKANMSVAHIIFIPMIPHWFCASVILSTLYFAMIKLVFETIGAKIFCEQYCYVLKKN